MRRLDRAVEFEFESKFKFDWSAARVRVRHLLLLCLLVGSGTASANGSAGFREEQLEATAGLKRADLVDAVCLMRTFSTPANGWQSSASSGGPCDRTGWASRWDTAREEQQEGGLVFRVFDSRQGGVRLLLFRHQEGEGFFDSDMWEAMSLWGRNFVEFQVGPAAAPGTWLSAAATVVQMLIFRVRRWLGLDYVSLASAVVADELRAAGAEQRRLVLGGYSMGGAIAQVAALTAGLPAVTAGSNGVADILGMYDVPDMAPLDGQLWNFVDPADFVPRLDCQVAHVCTVANDDTACADAIRSLQRADTPDKRAASDDPHCGAHQNFVYGRSSLAVELHDHRGARVHCDVAAHYWGTCRRRTRSPW